MNEQTFIIAVSDDDIRLDRWFKRHHPALAHSELQKACRKGLVRLDGRKAETGDHVRSGQEVRVKYLDLAPPKPIAHKRPPKLLTLREKEQIRTWELFRNPQMIIINKPAGLAVQGGTKLTQNLDDKLVALQHSDKEKPRLVHRLDKDTSGALVLARSANAAARLAEAFKRHKVEKTYLALCVGVPDIRDGEIEGALLKSDGTYEKMEVDPEEGKEAITEYRVLEALGKKLCVMELKPLTGRTHQLRVHMAELGHPILGDGKYGGRDAFIEGIELPKQLHLHAWKIAIHDDEALRCDVTAPLPRHMKQSFDLLGIHGYR